MSTTTVVQFATELKMSVAALLEQLGKAGVGKQGADDALTHQDKARLFDYLRRTDGVEHKAKITLTRKRGMEFKKAADCESNRKITITLRRAKVIESTINKEDPASLLNQEKKFDSDLPLTNEQRQFLLSHNVDLSKVFYAKEMVRREYLEVMKKNRLLVAVGVSPCAKGGHTMRGPGGNCIQCNPALLKFSSRYHEEGALYVAHSATSGLVKVGITKDLGDRFKQLNVHQLDGCSDWRLFKSVNVLNSGRIEHSVHSKLSRFRVVTQHAKRDSECRETFNCSPQIAFDAIKKALADFSENNSESKDGLWQSFEKKEQSISTGRLEKEEIDSADKRQKRKIFIKPYEEVAECNKLPKFGSRLDYDWPCKFKSGPFRHQVQTTEFLVQHHRAFCLSDMGSGKTASVLWAFDYLRKNLQANKMLVVSPLSTLQRTWGDEISSSFPHLRHMVLTGSGEERRKRLRENADIYIINHDGLKVAGIVEAINRRQDIDLVVIDEIAQAARSAATDRWKALAKIVRHELAHGGKRRAYGLTGTPTPNSPSDAWAQCRLLVPDQVPPYYNSFKNLVEDKVSSGWNGWVPKPEANDIVANAMQPSIRFKRDECIDLPPVTYQTREVELSSEQKRVYREMLITLRAEVDNGQITAVNELVKANKLLQIASGAAYKSDGETAFITPNERLSVTEEIIDESSGSIIVFVPFRGALNAVADHLIKKGITVGVIHGGVSSGERDRTFKGFQNDRTIRVLVAQPASMAHGLNLTAANTIIWFGPVYSNEIYQQSCARITRPGQVQKQLIVHIQGCPAEKRVYTCLREKGRMQGLLLEILRGLRED